MNKKLYFGSNLKMYKNTRETVAYLQRLESLTRDLSREETELFILPSYTSLEQAAKQIDQFSDEYDHYEYADRVDDKKSNIVQIYHDLTNGNAAPYRDFLEQVIEDSDEISVVQTATQLKNELDKAVSRPKESVIDQLKQISGQATPSKMSHSFKEPER